MTISATKEETAAAQAYEDLHVPAMFRQWAPIMLEAVGMRAGYHLLDVACGTGVVAREAQSRFGDHADIAGLDLGAGMLSVASRLGPGIEWRHGSAEELPFERDAFDAVVCQFGLMFVPNQPAAVAEMLRVLKPGGQLAVAVWDKVENSPLYSIVIDLLERVAGSDAANALAAPFALGSEARLEKIFADAGAASARITARSCPAMFPGIRTLLEADLLGWLPIMGVTLSDELAEQVIQEAEQALASFVIDTGANAGSVEFAAPALIVTAQSD